MPRRNSEVCPTFFTCVWFFWLVVWLGFMIQFKPLSVFGVPKQNFPVCDGHYIEFILQMKLLIKKMAISCYFRGSMRRIKCCSRLFEIGCWSSMTVMWTDTQHAQKNATPKKCWTKKMLSKIFGIRKPYIWKNKSTKKGNNNLKNNSGRHKIRCLFLECCYILSTHSDLQYKFAFMWNK